MSNRTIREDDFIHQIVEEAQVKGFEVLRESAVSVKISIGDSVDLKPGESFQLSDIVNEWSSKAVKAGYMVQSNPKWIRIGLSL